MLFDILADGPKGFSVFPEIQRPPPPPPSPSVIETKLLIPLFCLFGNIIGIINSMRESLMKQPFDIKHCYINIDMRMFQVQKTKQNKKNPQLLTFNELQDILLTNWITIRNKKFTNLFSQWKQTLLYFSLLDSGVTQVEMSSLTLWGAVITTVDWYSDAILTIKFEVPHPSHQLVKPQSPAHNSTWLSSSYRFVRLEILHHKCKTADRRGDSPSTTYITVKSCYSQKHFPTK